ncbi:MAG: antitoxin [Bdellovibrionales bacterium RIFOXYB2_FULL_36_6]|nr:MAG: antitoxin [Bdellovibrionales bacterium RIFOXYB2_FULL_36_6]
MEYTKRIVSDPDIMLGKPIIKGTRITVELILRKISEGMTIEELLGAYPHLTKEDILAAVSYSADVIAKEELIAPLNSC